MRKVALDFLRSWVYYVERRGGFTVVAVSLDGCFE